MDDPISKCVNVKDKRRFHIQKISEGHSPFLRNHFPSDGKDCLIVPKRKSGNTTQECYAQNDVKDI
jgi:hypothetical protein